MNKLELSRDYEMVTRSGNEIIVASQGRKKIVYFVLSAERPEQNMQTIKSIDSIEDLIGLYGNDWKKSKNYGSNYKNYKMEV